MELDSIPRATSCSLDFEPRPEAPKEADAALTMAESERLSPETLFLRGNWAKTNASGIEALERLIREHPKDALVNQARLRLVRRYFGERSLELAAALMDEVEKTGKEEEKARVPLLRAYGLLYGPAIPARKPTGRFAPLHPIPCRAEDRMDAMLRSAALAHRMRDYPAPGWPIRS
jgi:hypothetical protein